MMEEFPKLQKNIYINNIPMTKVGSETPKSDKISMILLKKTISINSRIYT